MSHVDKGKGAIQVLSICVIALIVLSIFGSVFDGCIRFGASAIGLGDFVDNPNQVESEPKDTQKTRAKAHRRPSI